MSISKIQREVIYKMYRRKVIGGVHKSREDISKLFRKDLRGKAKAALDRLVRSSLVVVKPTSYGKQYTLNRDRLEDIERIVGEYLGEE
jgi:hypothetical protein